MIGGCPLRFVAETYLNPVLDFATVVAKISRTLTIAIFNSCQRS